MGVTGGDCYALSKVLQSELLAAPQGGDSRSLDGDVTVVLIGASGTMMRGRVMTNRGGGRKGW